MIYRVKIGRHSWRPGPLGHLHLWLLRRFKGKPPLKGYEEVCGRGKVEATYFRGWSWTSRQGRPTPWTRSDINMTRSK